MTISTTAVAPPHPLARVWWNGGPCRTLAGRVADAQIGAASAVLARVTRRVDEAEAA